MVINKSGTLGFYPFLVEISYLDSIGKLIDPNYNDDNYENRTHNILTNIYHKSNIKNIKQSTQDKVINNLKASWSNELALFESLNYFKLKFAQWDIIKFYYEIYSCTSAMSRIICQDIVEDNHYQKISVFNNNILMSPKYSKYVMEPLNIVYKKKSSTDNIVACKCGSPWHNSHIEKCLININSKKKVVSLMDFFKSFREFANYNSTYLMSYLYGDAPKRDLSVALKNISLGYQVMTENFMISTLGFDYIHKTFTEFKEVTKNNWELDLSKLEDRFRIYTMVYKK